MKKLLLVLFTSLSVGAFAQSQIAFEDDVHDFGTINQGGNGVYEFKFKNSGKEPLIIQSAQGSCGCTVPLWPKEPIKPGSSNKIKVSYDTNRIGAFTKTVTVTSNDTNSPTKVLTIKGTVKESPKVETFPAKKVAEGSPMEQSN